MQNQKKDYFRLIAAIAGKSCLKIQNHVADGKRITGKKKPNLKKVFYPRLIRFPNR